MPRKEKGLKSNPNLKPLLDAIDDFDRCNQKKDPAWLLFKSTDVGSYFVKQSNQILCALFRKIRGAKSDCASFTQEEIDLLRASQADYLKLI